MHAIRPFLKRVSRRGVQGLKSSNIPHHQRGSFSRYRLCERVVDDRIQASSHSAHLQQRISVVYLWRYIPSVGVLEHDISYVALGGVLFSCAGL
jgi:hypothetical protein